MQLPGRSNAPIIRLTPRRLRAPGRADSLRQVPTRARSVSAEPPSGPLDDLDFTGRFADRRQQLASCHRPVNEWIATWATAATTTTPPDFPPVYTGPSRRRSPKRLTQPCHIVGTARSRQATGTQYRLRARARRRALVVRTSLQPSRWRNLTRSTESDQPASSGEKTPSPGRSALTGRVHMAYAKSPGRSEYISASKRRPS
jgi:hypothetical protein